MAKARPVGPVACVFLASRNLIKRNTRYNGLCNQDSFMLWLKQNVKNPAHPTRPETQKTSAEKPQGPRPTLGGRIEMPKLRAMIVKIYIFQ